MAKVIAFVEPKSASAHLWTSYISQAVVTLLLGLVAIVRRHLQPSPSPPKKRHTSIIKPVAKYRFRISSMGAVAKSRVLAKCWADRVKSKQPAQAVAAEAVKMGTARGLIIDELTWQSQCLSPITEASLARLDAAEREEELGSRVYRLVSLVEPHTAGKVTGMLLELDTAELLEIVAPAQVEAGADMLAGWVAEAQAVLLQDMECPKLPTAPPPSPAQGEWQLVHRGRRARKSHVEHLLSMAELESKLAEASSSSA